MHVLAASIIGHVRVSNVGTIGQQVVAAELFHEQIELAVKLRAGIGLYLADQVFAPDGSHNILVVASYARLFY